MKIIKKISAIVMLACSTMQACNILYIGAVGLTDGYGSIGFALKSYLQTESFFYHDGVDKTFLDTSFSIIFCTNRIDRPLFSNPDIEYLFVHNPDALKIAVSVVEFDNLPDDWATQYNSIFDCIVVPDPFLIEVHKKAGVTIPIFFIPQGIFVQDFVQECGSKHNVIDRDSSKVFTFGCSARNYFHKNIKKLIQAFSQEFTQKDNVRLSIHIKDEWDQVYELDDFIAERQIGNVEIVEETLSRREYLDYIQALDCYVLISRGEGFSITPREAMALGVPCILSNNTAHKTICDTGFVYPVPCPIVNRVPFYTYNIDYVLRLSANEQELYQSMHAYDFDCDVKDVQKAMRDMYEQYPLYCERAQKGIAWACGYEWKNIMHLYETLLRPQRVVLGDHDAIEGSVLVTTSQQLVDRYH